MKYLLNKLSFKSKKLIPFTNLTNLHFPKPLEYYYHNYLPSFRKRNKQNNQKLGIKIMILPHRTMFYKLVYLLRVCLEKNRNLEKLCVRIDPQVLKTSLLF